MYDLTNAFNDGELDISCEEYYDSKTDSDRVEYEPMTLEEFLSDR